MNFRLQGKNQNIFKCDTIGHNTKCVFVSKGFQVVHLDLILQVRKGVSTYWRRRLEGSFFLLIGESSSSTLGTLGATLCVHVQ